ncbi:hypothetical protein RJ641_012951 [Dillenia turbinata]|uniref:Uncharacterized protein n=1 Tax=Dillenia turbinata TaxID=194707 RepID=A0AAN8V049_9MAGN
MGEAGVDGALIVQPINHKFDHSYATRSRDLIMYPSKFVGCCLADPAEDGNGVKQLEDLDGYRAVLFNPYLWPAGQQVSDSKLLSSSNEEIFIFEHGFLHFFQITNDNGKTMFSKAGDLGIPILPGSGFASFRNQPFSWLFKLSRGSDVSSSCRNTKDEIFSELLKLS